MNKPIRRVSVLAALMFAALLLNISVNYMLRTDSLNNDSRNRRVQEAEFAQPRGPILVGNTPIVSTSKAETGTFAYQRNFADGPMWASVTGYYSFVYGRSKLEQVYNAQLTGADSPDLWSQLRNMVTGKPATGATVQTTLNAKAQQAAWDALGGRKGAVVAIDYTTGAILAYVSSPSYDPNLLAGSDLGATQQVWQQLNDDPAKPMADRAGREVYPPGSTFKLVTAAAALEAGWQVDQLVDAPAELTLPGTETVLGNDSNCGGEQIDMAQALKVSCNTAFANIGMAIGQDAIREQAERFGFNSAVESDVNSAASRFPTDLDEAQTAMSAIGQYEVAASPLQMAMVVAAIANNGTLVEPYLVSRWSDPTDLTVIGQHVPTSSQAVTQATARTLQDMMVQVVQSGSGTAAKVPGVRVGGKTGTAQSDPSRPNYAWFVGFADNPHVAIAVFVEDAEVSEDQIGGGRVAAPIFKKVLESLR